MSRSDLNRRAWLGVDVGTSGVRAVLVGDDGTVLGTGTAPLTSRRWPDGRHEQDPERWWEAVAAAGRQALAGTRAGAAGDGRAAGDVEVAGLACCATSGTVLLVGTTPDDPARPLTTGLMYDDGRATEQARAVARHPAPVWTDLGLHPQPTWALPKALWLVRHRAPRGPVRVAHQVDVITSRLVGEPVATDTGHALKTGADPLSAAWPADDLARLGLDPRLLPPLVRPGTVLGQVCRAAAERTGIPKGVPVIAGMTDGCAAQIAAGTLHPGQWDFVVGSTIVLKGVSRVLLRDPTGALYSHRSPDGLWWPGGASSAGGGGLGPEFARLEALAAREQTGCVTYPLVGVGERFPFRRSDAHRFTLGEPAGEVERFAAVLRGVGFVQRLCLDHVRSLGAEVGERVSVTGGAARSPYWTQLMADILHREVTVPRCPWGAFGMAVLAASGIASQGAGLASVAARMTAPARLHRPRADAGCDESYARLVRELARRGWIDERLAGHALAGAVG
jgi:xylulokinase